MCSELNAEKDNIFHLQNTSLSETDCNITKRYKKKKVKKYYIKSRNEQRQFTKFISVVSVSLFKIQKDFETIIHEIEWNNVLILHSTFYMRDR